VKLKKFIFFGNFENASEKKKEKAINLIKKLANRYSKDDSFFSRQYPA
jgi:hypothetical protein